MLTSTRVTQAALLRCIELREVMLILWIAAVGRRHCGRPQQTDTSRRESGNGETLKALLAMPFAENLDKSRIVDEPYYLYKSEISSALHRAIQHNESHCTRHLLDHGFDPNICLKSRLTPAHLLLSHDHTTKHGSVFAQLMPRSQVVRSTMYFNRIIFSTEQFVTVFF